MLKSKKVSNDEVQEMIDKKILLQIKESEEGFTIIHAMGPYEVFQVALALMTEFNQLLDYDMTTAKSSHRQ